MQDSAVSLPFNRSFSSPMICHFMCHAFGASKLYWCKVLTMLLTTSSDCSNYSLHQCPIILYLNILIRCLYIAHVANFGVFNSRELSRFILCTPPIWKMPLNIHSCHHFSDNMHFSFQCSAMLKDATIKSLGEHVAICFEILQRSFSWWITTWRMNPERC